MNADGSGVARHTDNPSHESMPSLSPDGWEIAFVSDRDGEGDIYATLTVDSLATSWHRLTDDSSYDRSPAWSPDGQRIAFMKYPYGEIHGEIYVMNADGSSVTQLTDNSLSHSPAWSPDSRRIAFVWGAGNHVIFVMNADGSGIPSQIPPGSRSVDWSPLDWSPDGERIAFESNREIYTMNADGTGVVRLTSNDVDDESPSWSPDGQRIAFVSNRDGNYEIYTMNADGSDVVRLTNNDAGDFQPSWGPSLADAAVAAILAATDDVTPTFTPTAEARAPHTHEYPWACPYWQKITHSHGAVTHTPPPRCTPTPTPEPAAPEPPTPEPLTPEPIAQKPPTPEPPAPPTVSAPAADGPIINCAAGQPCVDIQGERTEVVVGDEVRIAFSTINSLAQPPMTVSMTLQAPSGWTIVGEGISDACTSQCSAVYQIGSGKQRAVTFTSRANESGTFTFQGRLEWYFGNDRERIYSENKDIRVIVTEPTPTPTVTPTPAPTVAPPEPPEPESSSPNPWVILGILLAVVAAGAGVHQSILMARRRKG